MATHGKGKRKRNDEAQAAAAAGSGAAAAEAASSSHGSVDDEIRVDFDARAPCEDDYHGVRRLLAPLFAGSAVNLSELTDLIIERYDISTVLKIAQAEDDEDDDVQDDEEPEMLAGDEKHNVFGVMAVLDVHEDRDCVRQACAWLIKRCTNPDAKKRLQQFLSKKRVGWIISERFINVPTELSAPLFRTLLDELELDGSSSGALEFDHFLIIGKTVEVKGEKTKPKTKAARERVFVQPENEVFAEKAKLQFSFAVAKSDETNDNKPQREVFGFSAPQLKQAVARIESLVDAPERQMRSQPTV